MHPATFPRCHRWTCRTETETEHFTSNVSIEHTDSLPCPDDLAWAACPPNRWSRRSGRSCLRNWTKRTITTERFRLSRYSLFDDPVDVVRVLQEVERDLQTLRITRQHGREHRVGVLSSDPGRGVDGLLKVPAPKSLHKFKRLGQILTLGAGLRSWCSPGRFGWCPFRRRVRFLRICPKGSASSLRRFRVASRPSSTPRCAGSGWFLPWNVEGVFQRRPSSVATFWKVLETA